MSMKQLSRVECGYHNLYITTIINIAEALKIPVEWLICDIEVEDVNDKNRMIREEIKCEIDDLNDSQLNLIHNMISYFKQNDRHDA